MMCRNCGEFWTEKFLIKESGYGKVTLFRTFDVCPNCGFILDEIEEI